MQEQQQQQQRFSPVAMSNMLVWAMTGWAMTIYVPMRRNLGKEHVGFAGLVGLGWLVAWIAVAHAGPLVFLVIVYLFSVACHRIKDLIRSRRGEFIHTFYNGEPRLAMRLLRVKDENKAKGIIEPLLALALGLWIAQYNPGAGGYFMGGAFAMWGVHMTIAKQEQQRIDDMRNGMIENSSLMSHFPTQGRRRF